MLKARLALVASFATLVLLAASAPATPARAEERSCRGTLNSVSVVNLRVPQNATCRLNGTVIKGKLRVQRNGTLVARRIRVIGDVQAENARNVVVKASSRIGGSLQVKQGGAASVTSSRITGDIQYDANTRALKANANRVGGSIQVVGNSGGAHIAGNVVNGNLECKENRPAPTGGGNRVGGSKENQCSRF
jgi:hypothetical protein